MNWVMEGLSLFSVPSDAVGWIAVLLDVMLKATVILGIAAAITLGMRGASAALRHKVWGVALGSLLLLPVLSLVMPQWNASFMPAFGGLDRLRETPAVAFAAPPVVETVPPVVIVAPTPSIVVIKPAPPVGVVEPVSPVIVVVPNGETPTVVTISEPQEPREPVPAPAPAPVPAPAPEADAVGRASVVEGAGTETLELALVLPSWAGWILAVWSVGAALVMALLGLGLLRVWAIARRARPIADGDLVGMSEEIARDLKIDRRIRLLESPGSITPMTWGVRNPVVLMPREAASWSLTRRRDVLLHEFAHIKRNDYVTQLLARYACAAYWFNPFVWMAARQLRLERERACDDTVLNAGSRPSDYANHLLQIARSLKASQSTAFATVAMARPSQLTGRLLDVLDESRSRGAVSGSASAITWLGAAALVLPLASLHPGDPAAAASSEVAPPPPVAARVTPPEFSGVVVVPAPTGRSAEVRISQVAGRQCRDPDGDGQGTQSNSNDDRHTIRWWEGRCEGEVHIRGDVDFNDDFTDIVRLSRGGSFSIELDDGNTIREVEITAGRGGSLERRWFVDRREADYSDEAEAWLADALQEFFRRSSYMLDERVAWILDTRGVQGLLEEASLAYSGYLRARYYGKAIASEQLSVAEVGRVLDQAQREIESDYELSGLLRSVPARYLQDAGIRQTYVAASNSLESDYERGRVLRAMLTQQGLSDQLVLSLLQSAQQLDSDYELAKLLIEIAPRYLHNDRLRSAYVASTDHIESDYEHTRVLFALFEQPNLDGQILLALLESATNIESDYELSRLLQQTARNYVIDDALRASFFDAVNSVESDYEHRKILGTLLDDRQLAPLVVRDVLQSAMTIDSDFELGNVLREAAGRYVLDETLRPLFFRAVGTVDSDYERRRVLAEVANRDDASSAVILDVIAAAKTMSSDHEKGSLLMTIGQRHRSDEQLLEALMDAADTLDSDYEHGRVMRVLRGRARTN